MTQEPIRQILTRVTTDPWRSEVGFSPDIAECTQRMLSASSDDKIEQLLNEWLQRFQPCLFGRIAAKCNQISYCILRESDLNQDDAFIRDKIQHCRTDWTAEAFKGSRSGFIILAVSERLSTAVPDDTVAAIAKRLSELHLLDEVFFDQVHLEEVYLEQPGRAAATWRWDAGINYFAAHGDKRWWHDHRIPGGIGFSVNSVGHMAKSGLMLSALAKIDEVMETSAGGNVVKARVESLTKALELAMTTIDRASDAVSGKATYLLPMPENVATLPVHPPLPAFLAGKNPSEYFGFYHTDFTLPSEYFTADVERPGTLGGHSLDFTYLFDPSIDNPAHITMGKGRRVRPWDDKSKSIDNEGVWTRLAKTLPDTIPITEAPRLKQITSR